MTRKDWINLIVACAFILSMAGVVAFVCWSEMSHILGL